MFQICNQYPSPVWVAFQWHEPACVDAREEERWHTEGWWHLEPGQCAVVFAGDLKSGNRRYYYYYVETDDGAGTVWAGPFNTEVPRPRPNRHFGYCMNVSSTDAVIKGFREIDIENYNNYTLTLVAG